MGVGDGGWGPESRYQGKKQSKTLARRFPRDAPQSRQILAGSKRIPGMEPPQASRASEDRETPGASMEGRGL